jgi:hypothetical protein
MTHPRPGLPADIAKRLNASISRLTRRKKLLIAKMTAPRVEELRRYWMKEMDPGPEAAFRRGLDLDEKELVWLWGMIEKARDDQVEAWREAALNGRVGEPVAADPEWRRGRRRGRIHGRVKREALERIVMAGDRRNGRRSPAAAEDGAALSASIASGL